MFNKLHDSDTDTDTEAHNSERTLGFDIYTITLRSVAGGWLYRFVPYLILLVDDGKDSLRESAQMIR